MRVPRLISILSLFQSAVFGAATAPSNPLVFENAITQNGLIRFPIVTVQETIKANQTTAGLSRRQTPADLLHPSSGSFYLINRTESPY
jgi:hypothetical protein